MKVLLTGNALRYDLTPLRDAFPGIDFAAARSVEEVARGIGDAEVLVISNRVYTAEMVAAVNGHARALRWIHFTTSGTDKALKHGGFPTGVAVTHSPGLRAGPVAEHAFALLLFLARRLRAVEDARRRRAWIRDEVTPEVVSLRGRTLAILGMGAVGRAVARRARAFEMEVIAVSQSYRPDDLVDEVVPRERAAEALARADAVVVCMTSAPETRGFLDAARLGAVKPGAFLVNVARGDLVDEAALAAACRSGALAGAALDVTAEEPTPPESPLWDLPNVVLTPHIAGAGDRDDGRLIGLFAENLRRFLEGEPLRHLREEG